MTLWSGRFSSGLADNAWALNSSLSFDRRLAAQDVRGSIAWAEVLLQVGVLSEDEHIEILNGLNKIAAEFGDQIFLFLQTDEDIHTAVERRLGELIGATSGKLHTGRSRNDQVATDFRLWMLDALPILDHEICRLQSTLIDVAERYPSVLMPGYTHLQRAQPILFAHWLMSFFWMLQRDRDRLGDLQHRVAVMPLGSGALAGTSFDIDRDALAAALGFECPAQNSLDAVSDRDFAAEYLFCAALTGVHLSKLSESMILFTTTEFGYLELADAYSTGSSLMPQKKNADIFELTRAKAGVLIGTLTGLMTTLKGLPSTYDKDLQEDKVPVFLATDTLMSVLPVLAGAIDTMSVNVEIMLAAIDTSMLATDLADYLVREGVPFREAHAAVSRAVRLSAEKGISLKQFVANEWRTIGELETDLERIFDPLESSKRRGAIGGTSPESVRVQIRAAKSLIKKE